MALQNMNVTARNASVKLQWDPRFAANAGNAFGDKLQKEADAMILESIEAYIPMGDGILIKSGIAHTRIGSGKLIWRTPYARYLYYGMLMVDPLYHIGAFHDTKTGRFWSRRGVPKVLTSTKLKFNDGGIRGSKWPERWKNDNLLKTQKAIGIRAERLLHS